MASIETIQRQIVNSIQSSFDISEFIVIFGNATGSPVRPDIPYLSIKLVGLTRIGSKPYLIYEDNTDTTLKETLVELVEINFSCHLYKGTCFDNALKAQQALTKNATTQSLSEIDTTYQSVSPIKDYSVPVLTSYEHRAWFTLTVSSVLTSEDVIDTIRSISLNGTAYMQEVTEELQYEVGS